MKDFLKDEIFMVDLLRILSKISEKEKISLKICTFPDIENIIQKVF